MDRLNKQIARCRDRSSDLSEEIRQRTDLKVCPYRVKGKDSPR